MNYSGGAPVRQPLPEPPYVDSPEVAIEEDRKKKTAVASLRLLWEHRRELLWAAGCGLIASTILAFLLAPRYESTARLMPPDSNSNAGLAMAAAVMSGGGTGDASGVGGLAGIASDLLGLKSNSELFVSILKSRTVQDKLIEQFDLKRLYSVRHMEDARRDLAKHTDLSVDRKSQVISITVTDKRPERAAAMSQAYVEQLNLLVAELSTSSARRERIFLEGRLQTIGQDLEAAETEFSHFAAKNTALDVKEQGKAMLQAAATVQGQLIAAQSQYEGLRQIYTDNNARVVALKGRIDELQRQLEKLGGKGESSTDAFTSTTGSMYPSIRKLPLLGVTYEDLYRRAKIEEVVLESLTKEYEMARVQEAKEIPTVKVLDSAQVPDKKSFPPRLMIMFIGTLFALGIAATWVFAKDNWDQMAADDERKAFAVEVFSTLTARLPIVAENGSGNHNGSGSRWVWKFSRSDSGQDVKK